MASLTLGTTTSGHNSPPTQKTAATEALVTLR
jgi:hypothetical protein